MKGGKGRRRWLKNKWGGWKTHKMTGDTNECGYNCCASVLLCVLVVIIISRSFTANISPNWLPHGSACIMIHCLLNIWPKRRTDKKQKKNHTTKKGIHIIIITKQENKKRNRERFRQIRRKLASLEPFKPTLPPREKCVGVRKQTGD